MSSSSPAVTAIGLTKTYGRGDATVTALRGVDVAIERAAFTAIMGPSGSGKSTLLHCLAGLDAATSGRVLLGATDITALKDRELTLLRRSRLGFVFQSFNLLPMLSAEQNIVLPLDIAGRRGPALDRGWFEALVSTLGIGDRLGHRPSELSGGQQQRVAIARALVTRPDVVFADEPTGNLDSRAGADVLDLLAASVAELGQTVVMVTHDARAAATAQRALVMADGLLADDVAHPTAEGLSASLDALRSTPGSAPASRAGSAGPTSVEVA